MKIASRFTDLPARMLSVVIAAPLVLLAIWANGFFYDALIGVVIALGMYEWLRLQQQNPSILCEGLNMLALMGIWFLCHADLYGLACALLVALSAFSYTLFKRANLENADWVAFGLPYLGGALIALIALGHETATDNSHAIFFLLFTVWAADTGAYVSGRVIGGPKLAPVISPSKTWAGLLGAIVAAALIGVIYEHYQPGLLSTGLPVLAGFMGVAAQLGDMFESYAKRRAGVKDSGRILPGHGGILDRIDGLIVAAIILAIWHFAGQFFSAIDQ